MCYEHIIEEFFGFEDDAIYKDVTVTTKIDWADVLPRVATTIYPAFINISYIEPFKNLFTKFKRMSD